MVYLAMDFGIENGLDLGIFGTFAECMGKDVLVTYELKWVDDKLIGTGWGSGQALLDVLELGMHKLGQNYQLFIKCAER
jgi:hypothetical protein